MVDFVWWRPETLSPELESDSIREKDQTDVRCPICDRLFFKTIGNVIEIRCRSRGCGRYIRYRYDPKARAFVVVGIEDRVG